MSPRFVRIYAVLAVATYLVCVSPYVSLRFEFEQYFPALARAYMSFFIYPMIACPLILYLLARPIWHYLEIVRALYSRPEVTQKWRLLMPVAATVVFTLVAAQVEFSADSLAVWELVPNQPKRFADAEAFDAQNLLAAARGDAAELGVEDRRWPAIAGWLLDVQTELQRLPQDEDHALHDNLRDAQKKAQRSYAKALSSSHVENQAINPPNYSYTRIFYKLAFCAYVGLLFASVSLALFFGALALANRPMAEGLCPVFFHLTIIGAVWAAWLPFRAETMAAKAAMYGSADPTGEVLLVLMVLFAAAMLLLAWLREYNARVVALLSAVAPVTGIAMAFWRPEFFPKLFADPRFHVAAAVLAICPLLAYQQFEHFVLAFGEMMEAGRRRRVPKPGRATSHT